MTSPLEVTMPKNRRISPGQRLREEQQRQPGASALLSMTIPQERWTTPTPEDAPNYRPPLGRTRTRIVHDEFSGKNRRARERHAREYAERWYQALREWRVDSYDVPMPAGSGRGGVAVLLTSGTPGMITCTYLQTPLGREVGEVQAGRTISLWAMSTIPAQRGAGQLLERLRAGQGLASLVDERGGWASPRERAVGYAVAVLTLAVTLGDEEAEFYLLRLQKSGD